MRFFLIGFMGSGKSFWADRLADLYSIPLIDLDREIEKKNNSQIHHIINTQGELQFRKLESEMLAECIQAHSHFVMATGGGTACFHDNMQIMNKEGITIYLRSSPTLLYERLVENCAERPLLSQIKASELLTHIERLLASREAFYQQCLYSVNMDKDPESTFAEIFKHHA